MYQILAAISVILFLAAAPPYIIDIFKGKTKPERATWFIWSVLGVIAFISQVQLGAAWSLVFSGLDAIGSIITFSLSLKYGVGGWTFLDRLALVIAAIGVIVSVVARQPVIAILGVILADCSGTVLTILKTLKEPNSETTISWLFVGTGAVCGILSVGRLDWALILYPAYLMFASYSIPVTQVAGRAYWRLRAQTHEVA